MVLVRRDGKDAVNDWKEWGSLVTTVVEMSDIINDSITHVHRCIGSRKATRQTMPTSAKLKYLSVYDRRDGVSERAPSPSPPSSPTHVHRFIGSRNATRQTLPTSAKLTSLSMCDSRNGATQCM